ncbi:MAG: hypothetical protein M1299_06695 [Firmicutes bacterium]|nr:hypothetical protein [Bacillota bacterium]MCL5039496.1 hypothetical protein [Bacillota bacterium]
MRKLALVVIGILVLLGLILQKDPPPWPKMGMPTGGKPTEEASGELTNWAERVSADLLLDQTTATTIFPGDLARVGLVYDQDREKEPAFQVWRQVLREDGVPFQAITTERLNRLSAREIAHRFAAVILPDEVAIRIPAELRRKLEEYTATRGGRILLVYDAASQDRTGAALPGDPMAGLAGVERELTAGTLEGGWVIPPDSPLRPYFDTGVLFDDRLGVYSLPPIVDQGFRTRLGRGEVLARIKAAGETSDQFPTDRKTAGEAAAPIPAGPKAAGSTLRQVRGADVRLVRRRYPSGGEAVFLNGRVARQKYFYNDDLIAKVPLKFFLREVARVPRLLPSPQGKGTMVINLHVCSGAYFEDLDRLFYHGDLPTSFPMSIHITAGPDTNRPGDGTGVDARNPNRGLPYVRILSSFGRIGSHGGWIHNYWALSFQKLSYVTKKDYIDRNFAALEEVTGQPVTEYAAPGGAHSEEINDMLAGWGVRAVAYPVSFNSPPTHAWTTRGPEERFWHFGYTGTRYGTCFENMLAEKRRPSQIVEDTNRLLDEVLARREIRLFYFHPISIARHPEMWRPIRRRLEEEVTAGRLVIRTMTDLADFLDRHQQTEFTVARGREGYYLVARGPEGLAEMTFALPLDGGHLTTVEGLEIREEGDWGYVTVKKNVKFLAVVLRWKQ